MTAASTTETPYVETNPPRMPSGEQVAMHSMPPILSAIMSPRSKAVYKMPPPPSRSRTYLVPRTLSLHNADKPACDSPNPSGIVRTKDEFQPTTKPAYEYANPNATLRTKKNESHPVPLRPPLAGKTAERKRDAVEILKIANASLHKCRCVRKAIVSILLNTPEPRYSDLLKGFLANLDKIVTFLEKRRPVSSPVDEAQVAKCRSWVAMVIVPFYQKMEANPNAFRALLQPERAAARKDIIRRISTASNKALKRAMYKRTSPAAWDSSPRLEPVSSPRKRPASSPSDAFKL